MVLAPGTQGGWVAITDSRKPAPTTDANRVNNPASKQIPTPMVTQVAAMFMSRSDLASGEVSALSAASAVLRTQLFIGEQAAQTSGELFVQRFNASNPLARLRAGFHLLLSDASSAEGDFFGAFSVFHVLQPPQLVLVGLDVERYFCQVIGQLAVVLVEDFGGRLSLFLGQARHASEGFEYATATLVDFLIPTGVGQELGHFNFGRFLILDFALATLHVAGYPTGQFVAALGRQLLGRCQCISPVVIARHKAMVIVGQRANGLAEEVLSRYVDGPLVAAFVVRDLLDALSKEVPTEADTQQ